MPLADHHDMVEAFPSNRPNHPLRVGVLPRGVRRNDCLPDVQHLGLTRKSIAIDLVPVPDQMPSTLLLPARLIMYMSGITDEAEFNELRKTMTWEGHADRIRAPYLCLAGEAEELSPLVHTERLMKAARRAEEAGGLPGLSSLGRQRAGGESRTVSAGTRGGLDGGDAERQVVPQREVVRRGERACRQNPNVRGAGSLA